MAEKRRLDLIALTGNEECYLEIKLSKNGDMFVEMRGQNTSGETKCVSAQIPNPVNGRGNLEDYKTLGKIYDILKNKEKWKTAYFVRL